MSSVSLFTSINYERTHTFAEGSLSRLSNYFYLGGTRAIVMKGNEVKLEDGKVSWKMIALKVASYVLLLPLTLTLVACNLVLRAQYHFTVISPSSDSTVPVSTRTPDRTAEPPEPPT